MKGNDWMNHECPRGGRYDRPVARSPWTDQETEQAAQLWKSGVTATAIARTLGKSRNAVLGKIGRLGLKRNGKPATGTNYRRPRQSKKTVGNRISRAQWFRWTLRDEERLEQFWIDGLTAEEVAARIGCSTGAVNARAARLGLVRAEYPERYVSAEWFAYNNARFVSAMQKALDCGRERLPGQILAEPTARAGE